MTDQRAPCISFALSLAAALLLTGCGDDGRAERLKAAGPNPGLKELMTVADAEVGERQFRQCLACHKISKGGPDNNGPNLYNVYGQAPGQYRPRYPYTAALTALGGTWDDAQLNAWLTNPTALVPGTKMQSGAINDPLARADVIAYLRTQRD